MFFDFSFSTADNESLFRVNKFAHVLDTLLDNYDKRVRPDIGGKIIRAIFFPSSRVFQGEKCPKTALVRATDQRKNTNRFAVYLYLLVIEYLKLMRLGVLSIFQN